MSSILKKIGLIIGSIKATIGVSKKVSRALKESKKDGKLTPESFNSYKREILECIGRLRNDLKKLEQYIENAEKNYKVMKEY